LAEQVLSRLKREDRVHKYWVQTIARGDRVWGVLMLGHAAELA